MTGKCENPLTSLRDCTIIKTSSEMIWKKEKAMRRISINIAAMCSMAMYMCTMCMFCDADFQHAFCL